MECSLNALLLKKIPKKSASSSFVFQYYACNFGNRTGVLIGVIMAICLVSKLIVSVVHFAAVMFVFLAMFRIRHNMKIKTNRDSVFSKNPSRTGSSNGNTEKRVSAYGSNNSAYGSKRVSAYGSNRVSAYNSKKGQVVPMPGTAAKVTLPPIEDQDDAAAEGLLEDV